LDQQQANAGGCCFSCFTSSSVNSGGFAGPFKTFSYYGHNTIDQPKKHTKKIYNVISME
jgi:hypothetical protein